MKKILTVLLVLAVMTAGVFAKDASMTLSYKKSTEASFDLGWFDNYKDGISVTSHPLTATEASTSYTAYLAITDVCDTTGVKVSIVLPSMTTQTTAGSGQTQTITYTATIGADPTGKASLTKEAGTDKVILTSGDTSHDIATMTGSGENSTKVGWLPFTFALTKDDVDKAIPNATYATTLVATVASNS